ncbi:hypothetical protein BX265_2781 [Streptomyces sp. TLI_235]|nr:hypothetical protein [Streptomyces sp. TLI_235]PBC78022.1 hypothetical protein BX265_2781 [Streptomyces sp. TLI_235]
MPRFSPVAADALRAVGAVGGTALIVAGTYDTRWIPFLGCLAVAALSTTEFALARTRRFLRETEARTARQAELVAARAAAQALPPAAPPEIPPPAVRPPAVRPPAAPTVAPIVAGPPFADGRQLGADALLRLLEAVHRELRHAHEAADRAQAELADLSREWNALVQESMSPPPHARPPHLTPPHLRPPQVRAPAE